MRLFAIVIWLFPSLALGGLFTEPPEGLFPADVPDISITEIQSFEQYSREDGLVRVIAMTYAPITHRYAVEEFVEGFINGARGSGFQRDSVFTTTVASCPAKRIEGEFRSDAYEGAYNAQTMVIFTSAHVYTVSLVAHESVSYPASIEELAGTLNLEGGTPLLRSGGPPGTASYEAGVFLGQVLFWVVVVVAFLAIYCWLRRSKKKPVPSLSKS